jgi:hypothetical protein
VTSRERILSRLQSASARSRVPRAQAAPIATPVRLNAEAVVHRFSVEAQALGVECYMEPTIDAVRERLAL